VAHHERHVSYSWSNGPVTTRSGRLTGILGVIGGLLATIEWVTWRASRQALPADSTDPGRVVDGECVLVLGCPNRALHRWRVRIALRSTDPARARFVFSGGAVHSEVPEAQMMADYATEVLGIPARNVVIEDQSRTTVENIVNSLPLMADSPAIKIASDTFHARRARRILADESPETAQRLVRTRDYLPFERGWLHAFMLGHEIIRVQVARRRAPGDSRPDAVKPSVR